MLILDPEVVSVLALSPREHEAVADLLVQWSTDTTLGMVNKKPPSKTLDELIRHYNQTKAIDPGLLDEYLARSSLIWENARKTLVASEMFSRSIWRTACLLRGANDAAATEKLNALVADCRQTAVPIAQTWLDLAMSTPGPIPTSSGVKISAEPGDFKPKPR